MSDSQRKHPSFSFAVGVGLLSGAALGYEILLIRLLAIIEWHHLAFLVISLALLGYGASGTLLALGREALLSRFEAVTTAAAAGFGATSVGAFLVAQRIELNSLEIFWSTRELGTLFVLYLLFAVPFFCAATAIGLALTRFGGDSPRLYRADLIGGGASAALVTLLLLVMHPATALQVVAITGLLAMVLFAGHRRSLILAIGGIAAVVAVRPVMLPLRISQFKELSHAMRIPGARVLDERSSPLGLLTTVASPTVPFRHAPGLSLSYAGDIPPQIGVFTDGGGMTPIVERGDPEALEYLDYLPTAVAYHSGLPRHHVAVIGAGGGAEVLSALAHGADRITAVELNRQMVQLVGERFAAESGRLYDDPRVSVVTAEARRFIRDSDETFDVIQLALVGSHGASAAGIQAISESYLYTVEAMAELIDRLRPGGYLVVTRWMQAPPREVVKLLATMIEALERSSASEDGEAPVSNRIALLRGWNTATLIARKGAFSRKEVAALRRFCDDRSFDLDYAPGIEREETNQFNVLEEPYLYDAATALLAGGEAREDFYRRYKFHVRPATDERPYFFHSLRWSALPELLRLRARGGMPLLEWGYLILIAGLIQAIVAAGILILLPLLLFRRRKRDAGEPASRLVLYFGSIGLAFLFIEIAFMQRLTLFLGNPLYAIAVVLSSFLFFGGIGSGFSRRVSDRGARAAPVIVAVVALSGAGVVRFLTDAAVGLADPAKIAISVGLVAPLAVAMGMPFPIGLRRLAASDESAIPWAWGINGTASVLSSMLATLVALHFGFSVLVALAAVLYGVAVMGMPNGQRKPRVQAGRA